MSINVFLSTVSDEFRDYRDQLRGDLTRHNVAVKVQEDFKGLGGETLDKLDVYIAHCDAVVHLVGDMLGSAPAEPEVQALLRKHPALPTKLPPLDAALRLGEAVSYTQWEAWLALYHGKLLLIAQAAPDAPRGPAFAPADASRAAQAAHLARLKAAGRHPDCTFTNPDELAKHIFSTAILDLLVQEYASEAGRKQDVAEGFIREMASRVSADNSLDLEGMQRAVANAIDIYVTEIAGAPERTNLGEAVDRAIIKAKQQAAAGQGRTARATLRRTAGDLRREDAERRATYAEQVGTVLRLERDLALAGYDAAGAADAVLALAESLHPDDRAARRTLLIAESASLDEFGDQRGSNVHLEAAIAVRRATLALAVTPDEIGYDQCVLGVSLAKRGERDADPARLDQAVAAYRGALDAYLRGGVPLDWARTQNNLGIALFRLGERESGTARLEVAVTVYREVLLEYTRERVPLNWAATQNNLGVALWALGERESGTALQEAVTAYRDALLERTRARVPLDWATTKNNLGIALGALGERENGTARLEEAVTAYRDALLERTRARMPLDWATTQHNLGGALRVLGERASGTARLEEAVTACRDALLERTRARVPLDWAFSRHALAETLSTLAQRRQDPALMDEAVAAMRNAAEVYREGNNTYWLPVAEQRITEMEAELAGMP